MTTGNKHHSYVTSMRSIEAKVDHYANREAFEKGAVAAHEQYPAALTPVEYQNKPELADEWHKGFMGEIARIKRCVQ